MNLEGARRAAPGPAEASAAPSPSPDPPASSKPRVPRREPLAPEIPCRFLCIAGAGNVGSQPRHGPVSYLTTWKAAETMSSLWSAMPM